MSHDNVHLAVTSKNRQGSLQFRHSAVQAIWWTGPGRRQLCWSVRRWGQVSAGHPCAATDRSSSMWPARQSPPIGRSTTSQETESTTISNSPSPSPVTSFSSDLPLCTFITPSLFHSRLKTYLFTSHTPVVSLLSPGLPSLHGPFLLSYSAFVCIFPLFFVSGPCARLSWPSRQLLSAR